MRPLPVPARWAVLAALMLGASTGCVSVDAEKTGPRPSRSAGAAGAVEEQDSGVAGTSGRPGPGDGSRHHTDRGKDGKPDPKRADDSASPSPSAKKPAPGRPKPSRDGDGGGAVVVVPPGITAGPGDPGVTAAPVTPDPTPPPVTDPAPGGDTGGPGQPAESPDVPEEPSPPAASPVE
ncbi:hypothetical protein OG786_16095 [Streptomyces sp. NBC_00101]|uniref:hypothetical protein n=1 Tax=Streptomyces sp. NBC_00101 TaxID=2975651 RepID=UPI00325070F6